MEKLLTALLNGIILAGIIQLAMGNKVTTFETALIAVFAGIVVFLLGITPIKVEHFEQPELVDGPNGGKVLVSTTNETIEPRDPYPKYALHELDNVLSAPEPANSGVSETFIHDQDGGSMESRRIIPGALHSGDIVNIQSGGKVLQRKAIDSTVVMDPPIKEVISNIGSLRFELETHNMGTHQVINYGDKVYLKHNAYADNKNMAMNIDYGKLVQSHQTGPVSKGFVMYDPQNLKSEKPVKFDRPVLLAKALDDTASTYKRYLKIKQDKTISLGSTSDKASQFDLVLSRMFELYNKHLCVCSDDRILP